jgi:2-dehydro-3-deoxygalactonokinase
MRKFISCDWGTSALRLKVVDVDSKTVMAEASGEQGISGTVDLWKQSGMLEDKRMFFYQSILKEQLVKLEQQLNVSLQDVPVIISGMASSNIGMLELPYKQVPLSANGNDLTVEVVESSDNFMHKMLLISGIRTNNDVMRGEETQLIGCLNEDDETDQYFIFTGTHSKHVMVKSGMVVDFKTYMTGEFFALLSKKSVLSSTVEDDKNLYDENNMNSFDAGVKASLHSNLLHAAFLVRTNHILGRLPKKENYFYLSGLLIGTEMKELPGEQEHVTLVSNKSLSRFYEAAFKILHKGNITLKLENVDEALLKGHLKVYSVYSSSLS